MKRKGKKRDKKKKKKKDGNLAYLGSKKKRQPQKNKGVNADEITWDAAGSKGVGKLTRAIDDGLCLVDGCGNKANEESPLGGLCTDHWLTEKQEGKGQVGLGTYRLTGTPVTGARILDSTVVSTKIRSGWFMSWWRRWF